MGRVSGKLQMNPAFGAQVSHLVGLFCVGQHRPRCTTTTGRMDEVLVVLVCASKRIRARHGQGFRKGIEGLPRYTTLPRPTRYDGQQSATTVRTVTDMGQSRTSKTPFRRACLMHTHHRDHHRAACGCSHYRQWWRTTLCSPHCLRCRLWILQ